MESQEDNELPRTLDEKLKLLSNLVQEISQMENIGETKIYRELLGFLYNEAVKDTKSILKYYWRIVQSLPSSIRIRSSCRHELDAAPTRNRVCAIWTNRPSAAEILDYTLDKGDSLADEILKPMKVSQEESSSRYRNAIGVTRKLLFASAIGAERRLESLAVQGYISLLVSDSAICRSVVGLTRSICSLVDSSVTDLMKEYIDKKIQESETKPETAEDTTKTKDNGRKSEP